MAILEREIEDGIGADADIDGSERVVDQGLSSPFDQQQDGVRVDHREDRTRQCPRVQDPIHPRPDPRRRR